MVNTVDHEPPQLNGFIFVFDISWFNISGLSTLISDNCISLSMKPYNFHFNNFVYTLFLKIYIHYSSAQICNGLAVILEQPEGKTIKSLLANERKRCAGERTLDTELKKG